MGHTNFFWVVSVFLILEAFYCLRNCLQEPDLVKAICKQITLKALVKCLLLAAGCLMVVGSVTHRYPPVNYGWFEWAITLNPTLHRYFENTDTHTALTPEARRALIAIFGSCALLMTPWMVYRFETYFRFRRITDTRSILMSALTSCLYFAVSAQGPVTLLAVFVIAMYLGKVYQTTWNATREHADFSPTEVCDQRALEVSAAHSFLIHVPIYVVLVIYVGLI